MIDKNINGGFMFKDCKNEKVDFLEYEKIVKEKDKYKNKLNEQRNILKEAGIEYLDELKEIVYFYKNYKDEFLDFINMKKNNININNNNIDIINSPEYIKLKQDYISLKTINDDNNSRILDLETKLGMLTSNIEDNDLFKKIKTQNNILLQNNKTLNAENEDFKKKLDILENNNINISDIKEDSIDINLKINEALESQKKSLSQEYENKYSKNVLSLSESIKTLEQTIKDLNEKNDSLQKELEKIKLNSKTKKIKKEKNNENIDNKYGIFIFDKLDEGWQKYISCFTYKDILKMIKLDMFINDDNKINKESYKEVYEWMNIYELDEKKIKSNYNIKRKIKRCKILYNKHHDDLKYIKFNINILSYLKNNEFDEFLNILDEKIQQRILPNNEFDDLSDNILNINKNSNNNNSENSSKKCGNFGHGCYNEVTDRKYCQECMEDGYYTSESESD